MSNRSSSYGPRPPRQSDRRRAWPWGHLGSLALLSLLTGLPANTADAPDWLHALTSVALPAHEETTSAVLLYSEDVATVRPDGRVRTRTRKAYRILRPDGQRFADVVLIFDSQSPITAV